jgi:hypothetical protein
MDMKTPETATNLSRLLFIIFFVLLSYIAFPQESETCAEKLKNAQSLFDKGQGEQIPSLLRDCLKSGFKKEEELTAYKLLIQTYLLSDKIEQADSTMFEFLKKNPEYQLSPTDHSSFVYLFNSFKVKPVVQIGIHALTNIPFMTFVSQDLTSGESGKSKFNSKVMNLFFSIESKFKITDKLEAGFEIGYSQMKFSNKIDYMAFTQINYSESQQRIELPITATYNFASFGKFTAFSRAGIGAAYNFSTAATASYTPVDKNNNNSRTGESLNRKDSRTAVDFFGQIGAGIKYKIPRGFLFAEIRSNLGILEQNVAGGKTVPMLEYYYLWSDPHFRFNALNINIGYSYVFYKPTKRKE